MSEPEDQVANLEQSLEALEALVERLESGELPLAAALEEFERGVQLTRRCQAALKAAEQRVEILLKGDSEPTPFDDAGGSD